MEPFGAAETAESQIRVAGRPTLSSSLAVRLRGAIMRGELGPGEKLHLDDLRARFAVSLSPLREALARLAAHGLVVFEDQRGYRVAPASDDDLAEVIRLRSELEPLALREAMAKGDETWRAQMTEAWNALKAFPRNSADPASVEGWEELHRRYHLTLFSAANMPRLVEFIVQLHDHSDRYRRIFLQTHPNDRDVPSEHARIIEAVLDGEAGVACALLRQHIERTGRNIRTSRQGSA